MPSGALRHFQGTNQWDGVMWWQTNELLLILSTCALMALAIELGCWLGRRHHGRASEAITGHINNLQSAILGLLALLLGFTFSMALARFDARKALVVDEANAIGTAALRAEFLPEPDRLEAHELLADYAASRLDFFRAGADPAAINQTYENTNAIQSALWAIATARAQAEPQSVPGSQFNSALNELFDLAEKRRAALDNHVPEAVITLLVVVTLVAFFLMAYSLALQDRRRHGATYLFALLIAFVLGVILDLDRPRRGFVQVSQASMERTLQSLRTPP